MTWLDELESKASQSPNGYYVGLMPDELIRLVRGYRAMQSALEESNNALELIIDNKMEDVGQFTNEIYAAFESVREALSLAREMGGSK